MTRDTRRHGHDPRGAELRRILGSVRRRWRARVLLKGASLVVAAGLVAFLGSAFGVEWFRFSPAAVTTFRWIAWGTVLGLTAWFIVRPLIRRVSDEQVALYLEEHEPTLEAAILGAVAARDASGADAAVAATPRMLDRLVERAIVRARTVDDGRGIEKQALLRNGGVFAALTAVAVAILLFGPSTLRTGVSALLPTRAAAEVNPYSIMVEPGDLTVARGSDQFVTARLQGFASDEVSVFTRSGEGEPFQRLSMIPGASTDEGAVPFEIMLLNLQSDTDYFVESDGIRSPTHTITVADLPYVDRMSHEYRYPSYTGLEPRVLDDAGDIAALQGTDVVLTIQPTIPTAVGRIILDSGDTLALSAVDDGSLRGTLPVSTEGFYGVELAMADGTFVEASPRYTIDLLTDARPMVRFETPGRDSPASPIEEVYLEIQADDDYGVREVLLAYSVNGRPEDTVAVYRDAGPPLTEVTAGHTLYLEDYEVEPGDVVSYYAVARDQLGPVAEVKSDIYFLTIQPFRREFREAEQQGGGPPQGGGGAMGGEERLSELQRQVVAATFNLDRDRERYDDAEYEESTTAVALAQSRVREQVATLVERMNNRGLTQAEDDFRAIAEMLPEALAAMDTAEARLRAQEVQEALAPEQQALRVLQKAEESYEVYVGQQQGGGGGGGGGNQANAEDLADLFELELDKLRNQYETVQRGERQEQADEVDEIQERLEELARRQQQEAERQRARAAQGQQGGGSGAQSQRELADQTEEAARQLERLARDTNDRQLQETARQLQEAADAMRRSAAQGGNAGAAESARAQERLAEAQRRLERSRETRVGEDAQNALDRLDRLQEQQEQITEQVSEMAEDPSQRGDLVQRLQERKTEMAAEIGALERDLDRLAADARQEDPAAARELNEAAEAIRRTRINQEILWSRGVVQSRERAYARIFEEGIEADLEEIREQVAEARDAAEGLAEREGMTEALDQARDLVRGMESLDRRLDAPPTRPDSLAEGEGEGGEARRLGERPGQEGQQGEEGGQQGQQGEQGGQEGQQGGQQGQQGGQQGQQGGQQGEQGGQQGEGQAGQGGENAGRSSPDGSPATDGSLGGGATRGDPIRSYTEDEIRQFAREFEERLRQGSELRDALREQGQDVGDLDRALEAMDELRNVESYTDLPQVEALRQIVRENLGRVEFTLRRMVEGEAAGRAAIRGSDDVPPGFEELVEEYYRNLARSGGGGGGR